MCVINIGGLRRQYSNTDLALQFYDEIWCLDMCLSNLQAELQLVV